MAQQVRSVGEATSRSVFYPLSIAALVFVSASCATTTTTDGPRTNMHALGTSTMSDDQLGLQRLCEAGITDNCHAAAAALVANGVEERELMRLWLIGCGHGDSSACDLALSSGKATNDDECDVAFEHKSRHYERPAGISRRWKPKYPEHLVDKGVHGTAIFRIAITRCGRLHSYNLIQSSSSPELDALATKSILRSKWRPALAQTPDGPVRVDAVVEHSVRFMFD